MNDPEDDDLFGAAKPQPEQISLKTADVHTVVQGVSVPWLMKAFRMVVVALLVHHRGRQIGWNEREAKGESDLEEFVDRADEARNAARRRNDAGGLREDDGFKRGGS